MSLGTTTWKKRNEDKLLKLLHAAKEFNFYKPDIIHIGPGGGVNFMMDLLPAGQKENWSATDKADYEVQDNSTQIDWYVEWKFQLLL